MLEMSQKAGQKEAIDLAISKLAAVDLTERALLLGLPVPENGVIRLRAFARNYLLRQSDFSLVEEDTGAVAKPGDQILVLHYLLHDLPVQSGGELITFRDFPGGQFYWQPFLSRTVMPLVANIENDMARLQRNLARFDWEPLAFGDLGARIHTIGQMYLSLVYRAGDDEFAATADILFDSGIKKVYIAEDAAALASRVCLGLL
jgi:Domain of unknown function (DUF3786)